MVQKRNTFNHSYTGDDALINKRDPRILPQKLINNPEQQNKISPAPASGIGWRTPTAPEIGQHQMIRCRSQQPSKNPLEFEV